MAEPNRKELGHQLWLAMDDVLETICRQWRQNAGDTYITNSRMERVHNMTHEMTYELLPAIRKKAEEYFVLAPEDRLQINQDLRMIEEEIRKWKREIERIYHGNLHPISIGSRSVPVYRRVDSFCELARSILGIHPTDREYIGQRKVLVENIYDEQGRLRAQRSI